MGFFHKACFDNYLNIRKIVNMKVLVLAPHQDDEIILCGCFLKNLIKKGNDVYIVFMTNGNYERTVHTVRLEEALRVGVLYGMPEDNIIFMGYANEYDINEPHIYNAPNTKVLHSQYGISETYGLQSHPEYCFQKYGIHHEYTRQNLINDLTSIIDELHPDLIFATGEEIHPDHSANSLFLDEVLGNIFNRDDYYRPMVLKKPEYSTAWFGPADYSDINNPPAIFDYKIPRAFVNGHRSFFYDPYLRWNDRVSIPSDSDAPKLLRDALMQYSSQDAIKHFEMLMNSDVVFWLRRTDSLTYNSQISCSSGEPWYLHDFKRNDTSDLKRKQQDIWEQDASIWRPSESDITPCIYIDFGSRVVIREIVIYQEYCSRCLVRDCCIRDENENVIWRGPLEKKRATSVLFQNVETRKLTIQILKCVNRGYNQPGITEIEVFSCDMSAVLNDYFMN